MNIDFPAVESSGRVADIAAYGEVCHVLVKVGNAITSVLISQMSKYGSGLYGMRRICWLLSSISRK